MRYREIIKNGISRVSNVQDTVDESILRNIVQSVFYKGGMILGQFLLIPLIISILSKEKFAIWITLFTVINLITVLDLGVGNGLRNRLAESVSQDQKRLSKRYVTTAYFLYGGIGLAVILLYTLAAILFDPSCILFNCNGEGDGNVSLVIHTFLLLFLVKFFLMTPVYINFAIQKSSRNDFLQFTIVALTLSFTYGLSRVADLDLLRIAVIYGTVPIVVYAAYSLYLFKTVSFLSPSLKFFDIKVVKNLLSIGGNFFFIQIVTLLLFSAPIILIGKLFSLEKVAEYSIASRLYGTMYLGLSILLVPFWSEFTRADARNRTDWLKLNLKKVVTVSYCVIGFHSLLWFISPYIYQYWIKEKVIISYRINLAVFLFYFALILIAPLNYYLNGRNLLRPQVYLSGFNLFMAIPFYYFFSYVLKLDSAGIVFSSCALLSINYLITYVLFKRRGYF